jgi:predicted DCC family thiol-disulfide oxidoreductase YuxK/quercetin dioxygenase-like cupin family protein
MDPLLIIAVGACAFTTSPAVARRHARPTSRTHSYLRDLFEEDLNLLFDSKCALCRWEVESLTSLGAAGKIRFSDVEDPEYEKSAPGNGGITYAEAMSSIRAVRSDGEVLRGLDAFVACYEAVGVPILGAVAKLPILGALIRFGYDAFATIRTDLTRGRRLSDLVGERERLDSRGRLSKSALPRLSPPEAGVASLRITCGDSFAERLAWLCSLQGRIDNDGGGSVPAPLLRVQEIRPADAPRYARVAGCGLSLILSADEPCVPLLLVLPPASAWPEDIGMIVGPPGCTVQVLPEDPGVGQPRELRLPLTDLPTARPTLTVSQSTSGEWGVGRAGMLYRDLLPDRAGGALIVSHIRIETGGIVPDYVHYHRVQFQMIYVLRGFVEVVYEGQGEPFLLREGDFVTQPPTIRHRVLRCSDGLEVLEVGAPAEHATLADHEWLLPDEPLDAETLFGGQRFVRHVCAEREATSRPSSVANDEDGIVWRETEVAQATDGLASVRLGRIGSDADGADALEDGSTPRADMPLPHDNHNGISTLTFVLDGHCKLQTESGNGSLPYALSKHDCAFVPSGQSQRLVDPSPDLKLLQVGLDLLMSSTELGQHGEGATI